MPIRQVTQPILQVPPPDLARDGSPVPPTSAYVQKMATNVQPVLQPGTGFTCFLDPAPAQLPAALLQELLTRIGSQGGTPQPVYMLTGSGTYARLYTQVFGSAHTAIIRIGLGDINPSLAGQLAQALQQYGLAAAQTLLLLDMGDISTPGLPLNLYEAAFANAIFSTRSLQLAGYIVASCALPATLPTSVQNWQPRQFIRHELAVFRHIKATTGEDIHFGDYTISNVITGPAPSRQGSPKVRYTLATEYEVVKGQQTGATPFTMSEQYNRLSLHLVGHAGYSGRTFSWGDDYIYKASQPGPHTTSRGNPAMWVTVHTSHHIELVVSMLPSM